MADKIVVMHGGQVEQIGSPLDLYDRPANVFVAGFIGSPAMNLLRGTVEPDGFTVGDTYLPLPPGALPGDAIYGIRPEHWRLDPAGIQAVVTLVEPTGSETQVMARIGETPILCAFRERITARPGEIIGVAPDAAAVHLFDGASGMRLN